jgi:hypothetical protein
VIRALALAFIPIALLASGCGGDSSKDASQPAVSIPAVTSPIPATTTTPSTTSTQTGTTSRGSGNGNGNGGTGPPQRANRGKPDTATNDVPPPPGSPQARFENQCNHNPQACG